MKAWGAAELKLVNISAVDPLNLPLSYRIKTIKECKEEPQKTKREAVFSKTHISTEDVKIEIFRIVKSHF